MLVSVKIHSLVVNVISFVPLNGWNLEGNENELIDSQSENKLFDCRWRQRWSRR